MKHYFLWCLLGLFCFGCGQTTPPPPAPTPVPEKQPEPEAAPTVAVDSTYLIDDFLAAAAKTRSPYTMSKGENYPLFGFSFTPTQFMGYGVHEGGYDTDLSYDAATKKYTSKPITGLPAFEFVVNPDGSIKLTYLKSKKSYTFHKVPDVDSALRKVLFEGSYTDTKTKATVTFRSDGTLTGLGTVKNYQPIYDYMGGPLNFDEIIVQEKADPAKESFYHYQFKGNTLELYEAIQPKENDAEGLEKIGELRYTLTKN